MTMGYRTYVLRETEAGLFYENGKYVRTLGPGQYRVWNLPWKRQEIGRVELRRQPMTINGQEMLTSDGLSVRLNVAAEFRVVDAARAVHSVQSFVVALYTSIQIILRDEVQSRTIDELLRDRTLLSAALMQRGQVEAEAIGLELTMAGVKDVVLPGDVKRMLSQEIEAQRSGRAALVAAREETAAARARANTAQILAGNPVLLRLREIEALAQIGNGLGNTVVLAVPPESTGLLAAVRPEITTR